MPQATSWVNILCKEFVEAIKWETNSYLLTEPNNNPVMHQDTTNSSRTELICLQNNSTNMSVSSKYVRPRKNQDLHDQDRNCQVHMSMYRQCQVYFYSILRIIYTTLAYWGKDLYSDPSLSKSSLIPIAIGIKGNLKISNMQTTK